MADDSDEKPADELIGKLSGHKITRAHLQKEDGEVYDITPPLLGRDKLEVCGHALDRLADRSIELEEVIMAIRRPDESGLPTQPGRERVRLNRPGKKPLDVVYDKLKDRVRIITVFKVERPTGRRRR